MVGHTGDTLCSGCIIGRRMGPQSWELVYSSDIHITRLTVVHFDERMSIVLLGGQLGPAVQSVLGVECANVVEGSKTLNVQLANAIGTKCSPVYKKLLGKPVLPASFKLYLRTALLPDHLVTGLIKNVLLVYFPSIDTNSARHAKISIPASNYSTLSSHLLIRGWFGRLFDSLHNKSLSCQTTATKCDCNDVHVNNGTTCSQDLHGNWRVYIEPLYECIKLIGHHEYVVDKPNAHKLIELCVHTFTIFGHARSVSETVSKMIHNGLEKWLEINTRHNSHIFAIIKTFVRD